MNKRLYNLDLLRIIAISAVVLMHTSSIVQQHYSTSYTSFAFIFTNIPNSFTRFAVPLFVMISGSLMINKGHDHKFLIKKSLHYMTLFLIWSLVYSIVLIEAKYINSYSPIGIIINTISDTLSGWFHFWYLFMICGIYITLPFIEILINNMNSTLKKYYIILCLIFSFIVPTILNHPTIYNVLGSHYSEFMIGILGGFILYFMLGYWLKNYKPKHPWIISIILIVALVYNSFIGCISSILSEEKVTALCDVLTPNTFIITICIFLLGNIFNNETLSQRRKNFLEIGSKLSFGVYLSHMLIAEIICKPIFNISNNCVISLFLLFFGVMVFSYILSAFIWSIPRIRWLVK